LSVETGCICAACLIGLEMALEGDSPAHLAMIFATILVALLHSAFRDRK
jgi:uncharacterized protein (DUF983 family)